MEPSKVALQTMSVTGTAKLFLSLELAERKWRVAASDGGRRVSEYTLGAGEGATLLEIIERARARFGLRKNRPGAQLL